MYVLNNALKNVVRNKGRNILTGSIMLAIIIATVISLIINAASGSIIDDYKARFGAKVFINPDTSRVSVLSGQQSAQTVPLPVIYAALAGSDCLISAELSCQVPSVSDTLIGLGENPTENAVAVSPEGGSFTKFPTMNVQGYTDIEGLGDFKGGFRGISSGAFPANDGECIVSEDFAELNGLSVGDAINIAQGMVADNPLSLTVTGIYFDFTQNAFGDSVSAPAAINVRNDIITNYATASAYGISNPRTDTAAYYLKSPGLISQFEEEARAAGLSYDYKVTIDEEAYNKIVGPVEGLSKISVTFMAVVLVLGGLVLILTATLSVRERKYEIGVLRAMGMKRQKVAMGLIYESLAVTAICLVIGLSVGAAVAQPVSNILLKGQASAAESNANSGSGMSMMYAGTQTDLNAKPLTDMDVNLSLNVVATIILISLLLVSVSSVTGISYITKFEPIKILIERN